MDIKAIKQLTVGVGDPRIPPASDYDEASGRWEETEFLLHRRDSTQIGSWQGEVGWVRIDSWPYDELCVMTKGSVELEDRAGSVRRFNAGDIFFVPQGFAGIWRTLEPSEKVFVTIGA